MSKRLACWRAVGRVAAALGLLWLAPGSARAQSEGFSLERSRRPMSGLDGLVVQSPYPIGHLGFSVQLGLEYSDQPLVLESSDGTSLDIVGGRLSSFLGLALGLGERVQVGMATPIVVHQTSEGGSLAEQFFDEPKSTAVGDLSFSGLALLFGQRDDPALALFGRVSVPSGSSDDLTSDGSVGIAAGLAASAKLGPARLVSDIELSYRPARTYADAELASELSARLGAELGSGALRGLAELSAATPIEGDTFGAPVTPVEVYVGGRFISASGVFVTTRFGFGLTDAVGTPSFRIGLDLGFMKASKPHRERDDDGDGLANDVDLCPFQAEDVDGFADADGCVDPDDDSDGVADAADQCRSQPEDQDGFEDSDGCPDPDNDLDGVPDAQDLCPDEGEIINNYRDTDGCPDRLPDRDGDGVADAADKCPNQPGKRDGVDGCPDPDRGRQQAQGKLPLAIRFPLGGARLGPSAEEPLRAVAELLRTTPSIAVLTIEGHSSSDGRPEANKRLSMKRANAVLNALVMLGVAPARLRAAAQGASKPVADDTSAAGREKNRRVSFSIAEWRSP